MAQPFLVYRSSLIPKLIQSQYSDNLMKKIIQFFLVLFTLTTVSCAVRVDSNGRVIVEVSGPVRGGYPPRPYHQQGYGNQQPPPWFNGNNGGHRPLPGHSNQPPPWFNNNNNQGGNRPRQLFVDQNGVRSDGYNYSYRDSNQSVAGRPGNNAQNYQEWSRQPNHHYQNFRRY